LKDNGETKGECEKVAIVIRSPHGPSFRHPRCPNRIHDSFLPLFFFVIWVDIFPFFYPSLFLFFFPLFLHSR